jgi:transcriptional regulator of acetoin/glycerol metabolism
MRKEEGMEDRVTMPHAASASSDPGDGALVERYLFLRDVLGDLRRRPAEEARSELLAVAEDLLGRECAEALQRGTASGVQSLRRNALDGFTLGLFGSLLDELDRSLEGSPPAGELREGWDPAIRAIRERIPAMARVRYPVLVIGERGTGKGRLVRAIHAARGGSDQDYFPVSCAGLSEGVVESQLFGHVKGAFTGAVSSRSGLVATAAKLGGTLVLDDIGEFPPSVQTKLLQVLEEGVFFPVGADRPETIGGRGERRVKVCATTQPRSGGEDPRRPAR